MKSLQFAYLVKQLVLVWLGYLISMACSIELVHGSFPMEPNGMVDGGHGPIEGELKGLSYE